MVLSDTIKKIISDCGLDYVENNRTIYTTCPICDRGDKLSILKDNGATICYHGSCSFGQQWFEDWLSLTAKISRDEAKNRIKSRSRQCLKYEIDLPDFNKPVQKHEIVSIEWPVAGFLSMADTEATEGASYLTNRGISAETAIKYDIRYSPFYRRVIFPIKMNNKCYGWQGRAIDLVDTKDRLRFNEGFNRASLLMFYDKAVGRDHLIVVEGPVDALKFDLVGGAIATMGTMITKKQFELINNAEAKTVYLGLDPDAVKDIKYIHKVRNQIAAPVKLLKIPHSCIERCKQNDKKPDFGECTPEECRLSFESAEYFDTGIFEEIMNNIDWL